MTFGKVKSSLLSWAPKIVKVCESQGLYEELKKRVEQEIANLTDKHLAAFVKLKPTLMLHMCWQLEV